MLHATLTRRRAVPEHQDDRDLDGDREDDGQEHGLLGDIRSQVRRRSAGMTLEAVAAAVTH
ncbi:MULTISPECIES: hypothetical protein [Kitasatospora]|uniref:TetR family transcriptional regulator n=1 Tax=Kitasatospora cystarginea TaxID=58350 RepID=A0ABN3F1U4_9ACTN